MIIKLFSIPAVYFCERNVFMKLSMSQSIDSSWGSVMSKLQEQAEIPQENPCIRGLQGKVSNISIS